MSSISSGERERALRIVAQLCVLSLSSERYADKEVAEKLGFGSVQAMHVQLENWGLPKWLLGGPSEERTRTAGRQRRARSGEGEKNELPPAATAETLFRETLEELTLSLEILKERHEYLKDERFVATEAMRATSVHSRRDWPEPEEWRELCEKLGRDPEQESVEVEVVRRYSVGAAQSPPGTLTNLIAVYVLAGKPIEPLLEKLHPDPDNLDRHQLQKHIEGDTRKTGRTPGLLGEARTVARLVRGGTVRPGPPTGELSPQDLDRAVLIGLLARTGVPDEQIRRLLEDDRLSKEEIARLRNLRLDYRTQ